MPQVHGRNQVNVHEWIQTIGIIVLCIAVVLTNKRIDR